MPFQSVVSSSVTVWARMLSVVRFEQWCLKIYVPSVLCFERGRDMCVGSVAGRHIDVWCDEEGFTPPLTTSKMAYDVTRRVLPLLSPHRKWRMT